MRIAGSDTGTCQLSDATASTDSAACTTSLVLTARRILRARKAAYPLEEEMVTIDEKKGRPGKHEAKFDFRPHYRLEGVTAATRLV